MGHFDKSKNPLIGYHMTKSICMFLIDYNQTGTLHGRALVKYCKV